MIEELDNGGHGVGDDGRRGGGEDSFVKVLTAFFRRRCGLSARWIQRNSQIESPKTSEEEARGGLLVVVVCMRSVEKGTDRQRSFHAGKRSG
ncbi:hypothetical protein M5K25_019017 [Dendrobium thyrsiflorum]|uniref:Uncharacterized protein n=1 Tax=Dendrobium thyrsiflorum TaxID=117978 RepID=A0ABD0UDU4_DENTH